MHHIEFHIHINSAANLKSYYKSQMKHYGDVTINIWASQITGNTSVCLNGLF